jgi:hypothetical protein
VTTKQLFTNLSYSFNVESVDSIGVQHPSHLEGDGGHFDEMLSRLKDVCLLCIKQFHIRFPESSRYLNVLPPSSPPPTHTHTIKYAEKETERKERVNPCLKSAVLLLS